MGEREDAKGKQVIPLMWVFTYKFDNAGYLLKFKARICVRGDLQSTQEDTYAATLALKTFRALMAIAAFFDLEIWQADAVNAFLNSDIPNEVFIEYPDGFKKGKEKILRLLKALYGLKESPLLWYNTFITALKELGLTEVLGASCLLQDEFLIVFFYVDDIMILYHRDHRKHFKDFIQRLQQRFSFRIMADASWFHGIRIVRDRPNRTLWLSLDSYIDKLATQFHVRDLFTKLPDTPLTTDDLVPNDGQATEQEIHLYQQRVGSLSFAANATRPDVAQTHTKLARYLVNPSARHIQEANRALAYLYRTKTLAIRYSPEDAAPLFLCASDASFADDKITRYSSDGYIIMLFGGAIDWRASKQKTVTTSSTEAELLALSNAASEMIWWKRVFNDISLDLEENSPLQSDNLQTIRLLVRNGFKLNTRLRHVDIHRHWLRQEVQRGHINVDWVPTTAMIADGFTKPLPRQRFESFIQQLNMEDIQEQISLSCS